jgi:hypothetical protein
MQSDRGQPRARLDDGMVTVPNYLGTHPPVRCLETVRLREHDSKLPTRDGRSKRSQSQCASSPTEHRSGSECPVDHHRPGRYPLSTTLGILIMTTLQPASQSAPSPEHDATK